MGTLDPAFLLALELLITAKPLITDLTQINYSECSAHSTVSRDLTLKKGNAVDKRVLSTLTKFKHELENKRPILHLYSSMQK